MVCYREMDIGTVGIEERWGVISRILLPGSPREPETQETPLIVQTFAQLEEYFAGKRCVFDFPFRVEGTDFQRRVWAALCDVPYGQTASYKDIAIAVQCPQGSRAVGGANNKNPLPIVIPCHRVIAHDGKIGGYYQKNTVLKQCLIDIERRALAASAKV